MKMHARSPANSGHSFEKVMTFDAWPYTKKVVVLSSRNIDLRAAKSRGADVELMNGAPQELVDALAAKVLRRL